MLQYDSDKNSWSGLLVDLKNARKGIVDVGVEADNFFKKVSSDNKNLNFLNTIDDDGFKNFIKQNNLADESLVAFLKDTNYAQKDLANYQLYLKDTGKATTTFATLTKKAGNVVKSFTATLVSMGVSWLAGQALGLIIKGFSNLIHAEEIAAEKAKEVADASRETARAHSEERDQLNSLIGRYEELAQNENFDSQTRDEIKQIQADIVDLVGDEAKGIDLVNGKLDDQIKNLREITAIKAGETVSDYEKAYKDATDETKKAVKHQGNWAGWSNLDNQDNIITFDYWGDNEGRNKGLDIINKVWQEKGYGEAYDEEVDWMVYWDSYTKLVFDEKLKDAERAEAIQAAIDALENTEGFDYNDSELWRKLVEIRNSMTGQDGTVTKQQNAANDLLDAILVQTVSSGKDVSSADEYQKYIDEVVKIISENETVKEAIENGDLKLEDVNSVVTDYLGNMKKYSDYTKDAIVENHDKMTVSLSELEGASDKIKTLGSAFKELSDDGYITTKTLGEIQTATGLSGDEWAEYESKLLNAKKGSAEFSQIMADLTYKMLDQTFANKDLNSLTEQQISAILRENGVVNADAVAHDWLTKAKETLRIKTALAKASTAEEVVALATEASQAGITGNALNDLIMDMGIFNNTNLDVSQKVAALQEMGYYAHWTAQGLANIDKVKKYSFDGKDYIASYDKDGKLVGIEQETQVEIPNVEIPKITIPNYSGATSGGKSSSDKDKPDYEDPTDAIIDRINLRHRELEQQEEYIENAIEIAELENDYKKQISLTNDKLDVQRQRLDALKTANGELHQMAEDLRNSTPDWKEEEWFDSQGNETKAYVDFINQRKKDGADEEEIKSIKDQFEKISKIKKAWVENEKLINELTIENIKSIKEISDIESEALQSRFEERNADSERWLEVEEGFDQLSIENKVAAYARMVRNNREFLKEIEQDDKLSAEERDEIWKEYYEKIVDYQLEAYDLVKKAIQQYGEEVEKGYDIRISRLSSESSLLSTHFDLINAISEEQHNLNKELAEAEIAGAKMNELEKQTLFTKEEHTTLSAKLSKIMGDANSLQSDYLADLKTATEDTIEEITNNYERQYELKMKEYEVVKAELNLIKAQQKLENVENEKSVRTWNGTSWVYEADFQDVVDAKLAVEDAKYAVIKAETEQVQQNAINAIDSTADSLETQKNLFARTMEELSGETKITGKQLTDALKNIAETDLPTFEKIVEQFGDSLVDVFDIDVDSIRNSVGATSSSGGKLSHLRYSSTIAQMRANSAKWGSASQSEREKLHSTNIGLGSSIGASYDSTTGTWKDKNGNRLYANGTKNALPGWGMFDENGFGSELILTNDGILTQFNGGERVFDQEMSDRLWEMAQQNYTFAHSAPQLDFSKLTPIEERISNAVSNSISNISNAFGDTYMIKDVKLNESEGGELKGFINFLKRKV